MKKYLLVLLTLPFVGSSQVNYLKHNIDLVSLIVPNNDTIEEPEASRYSGCWGWYQAAKNREYAISGASNGTYFIDITNPTSPVVCDFVEGRRKGTWREMKTYQNYCYIVSDDAQPNKFTIVDMQYLPDSVHVVHYGNTYFERGHTIWIDQDKMYIGATTYSAGSSAMTVWSLATPTAPVLLRRVEQDIAPFQIDYVHDMYVRNDTIYASTGWKGLQILKLEANNTFSYLGSYQGYLNAGYNHSSFLTENGKYLIFCDEVPGSLPIHLVDVQNPGNIQPQNVFNYNPETTPHNPYVIGNEFAIVSSYQDGLIIYDISTPTLVSLAGYFDTHPQGGVNTGTYVGTYRGNWGAYPFLPSKLIIANDMQNGVFILDAAKAYSTTVINPVSVNQIQKDGSSLILYPNPCNSRFAVHFNQEGTNEIRIHDISGRMVYHKEIEGPVAEYIETGELAAGSYILSLRNGSTEKRSKLIVRH